MLIGLCGGECATSKQGNVLRVPESDLRSTGICAGKNAVADYLIDNLGFMRLRLNRRPPIEITDSKQIKDLLPTNGLAPRSFDDVETLLEFVTKQWKQRWVTTDIWDEEILENLLRRPSFILVSVDAPVSLRWKRFHDRCERQKQTPPTLEEFVIQSDHHLYDHKSGLACLIDRAEVRLINQTSSIEKLHIALEDLNLANEERLRPNWDQYFMQLASLAAQRSNCMKRRVGCVLVQEKRVISTGYNGTPRYLKNCNEGGCQYHLLSDIHAKG